MQNAGRDWTPMVLNQKTTSSQVKSTSYNISTISAKERKLENSTEAEKKELMPRNISEQLSNARLAYIPKLSQKDLANQLNLPVKTIQEIEQHRHIKDMSLAQRIATKLRIKLTR